MKEDKENARPKDRRLELNCEDGEKTERSKEKKEAMTKVELASSVSYSCYTSVIVIFTSYRNYLNNNMFLLAVFCLIN